MTKPSTSASGSDLRKITRGAAEISALFPLSAEGRALLEPDSASGAFIDRLSAAELWIDTVRFLAHALPKREAVWWGCLAARAALGQPPPEPLRQAVEAAEA